MPRQRAEISVKARFVCAWRPPTLPPNIPAPSPGRTPHDLSLWLADWFNSMGGSESWRRSKITDGVTTLAQRWRTVSAPPRVRLSNYRRHAHRGGTGDRASADPGIDERPVPQPRRKDWRGGVRRPGRGRHGARCRDSGECLRQRSASDHDRAVGVARRPATRSCLTDIRLFSFPRAVLKPLHSSDFVGFGTAWRLDLHNVPLVLADQRARDRRSY